MKAHNRDRWQQEQDLVSDVVERFSQACSDHNARNYAYESGWWSSMVKRLLMEVPRAQRNRELRSLQDQIRQREAIQIMNTLMRS